MSRSSARQRSGPNSPWLASLSQFSRRLTSSAMRTRTLAEAGTRAFFSPQGGTLIIALSSKTFKMQALAELAGRPFLTFDPFSLERESDGIGRLLQDNLAVGNSLRNRLRS